MDKSKFRTLVRGLVSRAEDNKYLREKCGVKAPTLHGRSTVSDIDAITKVDPTLGALLMKVEDSNKEVDDYILSRKESIKD